MYVVGVVWYVGMLVVGNVCRCLCGGWSVCGVCVLVKVLVLVWVTGCEGKCWDGCW